jgi:Zn-dependent protease
VQTDSFQLFITLLLYSLPGLVIGFTLHELAHALVSVSFGDDTPRRDGRLSLDPLTQIDPVGFGLLIAIGFGFARPVMINTMRIRTATQQALVALAGPATNLVLAVASGAVLRIWVVAAPSITTPDSGLRLGDTLFLTGDFPYVGRGGIGFIVFWVVYQTMYVNALLFVFNMIPIPPLDGFKVLKGALGHVIPDVIRWMERNAQLLAVAGLAAILVLPRLGNDSAGNVLTSATDRVVTFIYHGDAPPVVGFDSLFNALSGR